MGLICDALFRVDVRKERNWGFKRMNCNTFEPMIMISVRHSTHNRNLNGIAIVLFWYFIDIQSILTIIAILRTCFCFIFWWNFLCIFSLLQIKSFFFEADLWETIETLSSYGQMKQFYSSAPSNFEKIPHLFWALL